MTQIGIRITEEKKKKIYKLAEQEGKTVNEFFNEMIDNQIKNKSVNKSAEIKIINKINQLETIILQSNEINHQLVCEVIKKNKLEEK